MRSPSVFTKRLHLRNFVDNDIQSVYKGLSDPLVVRFYGVQYETLQGTQEQMEWFKNLEEEGTGRWWAITDMNSSAFLGAIGFNNLDRRKGLGEIGFWLLPEYQNQGYMSEALEAVEKHGFTIFGLNTIEAFVESENISSINLLQAKDYESEEERISEMKRGQKIELIRLTKKNPIKFRSR